MIGKHSPKGLSYTGIVIGGLALTIGLVLVFSLAPTITGGQADGAAGRPVAPSPTSSNPVLVRYLDRLTVLAPKEHEGLSIFPIVAKSNFPLDDYYSLDEALKEGVLRVTERSEGAQVNSLLLENTGDHHIFIMSGEIMKGAKQDRTMQNDLLVPPHSGKLEVNVFCTEHGRWVEKSGSFEASEVAVPNSVRSAARVDKRQSRVWDSIAANQSKLGVAAPTQAAKEVYADVQVQKDSKPYLDKLSNIPSLDDRTVGVAAAYGSRIIAVDIFGDTSLFRHLYPKLLRSYVVDVMNGAWKGSTRVADIERLLAKASDASWSRSDTDGIGAALEFHKGTLHGSALLHKEMVIHSDLFVAKVTPVKPGSFEQQNQINTPPPNLEQRREQHVR